MRFLCSVDDFERDGHGMGANHAVAFDLRGSARTDVFDVRRRGDAQTGGKKTRPRAHGAFDQRRFVAGGFHFAGRPDFPRLENHRPTSGCSEEFFGQLNHRISLHKSAPRGQVARTRLMSVAMLRIDERMRHFAFGSLAAPIAIALLGVLLSVVSARSPAPAVEVPLSPVVDDAELEEIFVRELQSAGEDADPLTGRQATEAVRAADGRRLSGVVPSAAGAAFDQEKWRRAVVVIGSISKCEECPEWHMDSVSAGWIMTSDGLVATNFHVLEDEKAEQLGVMTADGRVFRIKEIVAADRHGDAAILRLDANAEEWSWLPMAERAFAGEEVRILSHPDGRFYSLSKGIVSRLHRAPADDDSEPRIWTTVTADFGAGSSGAPVLNDRGEVIGMVSSTAALLADAEEGKEPAAEDVQMVFKDCVSLETMRGLWEN